MKNSKITPEMRHDVSMALDYERYLSGYTDGVDMAELHQWLTQWGGNPDVDAIYRRFRNAMRPSKYEHALKTNTGRHKAQMTRVSRAEREQLKMRLQFQSQCDALEDIHASWRNLINLAKDYRARGLTKENIRAVLGVTRRQLEHMWVK